MVETNTLSKQERLLEQIKTGITVPTIQTGLKGPDRLRITAHLDSALTALTLQQQLGLADYLISGVSQQLPQTWNGATQDAAVSIFSRIHFGVMDSRSIQSVRQSYLTSVYGHFLDYNNHEPAINLLRLGRHLLPHIKDVTFFDETRGVLQQFGRMTREILTPATPQPSVTHLDELQQTFDTLDQIKDAMGENKQNLYFAERVVRRQIVYLSQRKPVKEIARDLNFDPSTIEKDRMWLIAHGFVERKPPGFDVSEQRAVVAEITDLDYAQIAKTVGTSIRSARKHIRRLREQGLHITPKIGGARPSTELSKNAQRVLPIAHLSRTDIAAQAHLSFEQVRKARQELIREGLIESRRPQRRWTEKDRKLKKRDTVYQAQSTSK
jgi:transposase